MKSIIKLFKPKEVLRKINEGFVVEFDIKIGNNGFNHVVILPDGYQPTVRHAEKYIRNYLAAINSCLTIGEPKRIYDGIIQIYRMNITAPTENLTVVLNLNKC